jgi:hypothetical protein
VSDYQQDFMVLAYALTVFLLFGIGLLCLKCVLVMRRRPHLRGFNDRGQTELSRMLRRDA